MKPGRFMPASDARALTGTATGRQPYRTVRYPARMGPNRYIRIFRPGSADYIDVCPVAASGRLTATSYFSKGVSRESAARLLQMTSRLLNNVAHQLARPYVHYAYAGDIGAIEALQAARYAGDALAIGLYRPSTLAPARAFKAVAKAFLPTPSFEKSYERPGSKLGLRQDGEQAIVDALLRLAKKGGKR